MTCSESHCSPSPYANLTGYCLSVRPRGRQMRRRDFISLIGSAAATWPVAAHAQQVRILGALMNGNANEPLLRASMAALTEKLRELGWIEGKNLHLEVRWNGGSAEQARAFASELTALNPAVILSSSTTNLLALSNATNSIPIV